MGTLPMITQLASGRAETRGYRGYRLTHKVLVCPHTPPTPQRSLLAGDSPWQRGGEDRRVPRRNEASDWPPPATAGEKAGARAWGRRGEMTQCSGSLKAPAPSATDGAGAFRGLSLVHRVL